MVEWDGDCSVEAQVVISGLEKQVMSHCKDILQIFDHNWKQKGIDYGGWFTWTNYRKGCDRVQIRLD